MPHRTQSTTPRPLDIEPEPLARVHRALDAIRAGKMVILVDDEDRENEGDLTMAAELVTPEAINFMAKHGRGLICLTLTEGQVERLELPMMQPPKGLAGPPLGTAFTVSVEARDGVTTGISAADRAHTIKVAIAADAEPDHLVTPGHVFPLRARRGGVLVRAGQTEGSLDLARLAGLTPAGVICEIMNDDGTMARLPDLQVFAAEHGLKIGTIASLIEYRSRVESLLENVGSRAIETAFGHFTARAYRDKPGGGVHLALVRGQWSANDSVAVRVHEPLSVFDTLEVNRAMHAWSLDACLAHIAQKDQGVVVLLNCGESADQLLAQFAGTARPSHGPERGRMDLRTYGIGAQILRDCGVHKMALMGQPRRMPSMTGYGLEITGYITQ